MGGSLFFCIYKLCGEEYRKTKKRKNISFLRNYTFPFAFSNMLKSVEKSRFEKFFCSILVWKTPGENYTFPIFDIKQCIK